MGTLSDLTDFGFTGQRLDRSTDGLMYYGARYYLPKLRRFISADSVVPGAENPQYLNKYAYVLNSPLNRIDPTGNVSCQYLEPDAAAAANCTSGTHAGDGTSFPPVVASGGGGGGGGGGDDGIGGGGDDNTNGGGNLGGGDVTFVGNISEGDKAAATTMIETAFAAADLYIAGLTGEPGSYGDVYTDGMPIHFVVVPGWQVVESEQYLYGLNCGYDGTYYGTSKLCSIAEAQHNQHHQGGEWTIYFALDPLLGRVVNNVPAATRIGLALHEIVGHGLTVLAGDDKSSPLLASDIPLDRPVRAASNGSIDEKSADVWASPIAHRWNPHDYPFLNSSSLERYAAQWQGVLCEQGFSDLCR